VNSTITPPKRAEVLTNDKNYPTVRVSRFFEEVSSSFEGLPDYLANVADISTADATDLTTAIALANANKAKINELLAALQTAGVML
jgi:hypothetical protein